MNLRTDGVCVTSLTMGGDQVFAGSNNDQPSFWIDGDSPNCFPNHVSTQQMTVVNGEVTASECDPAFCFMITSSADADLCEHPKAGPSAWKGNAIEIFQNGNKVGSMPSGTKMFRFCLDYDQVNIENDVFKLARSGTDGVCVTSLSVDGNDILVGPNGAQPNFWIDGDDNDCTEDFVSTQELIIQNGAVLSSECDPKFCIRMTSSPDEDLCQHPKASNVNSSWAGSAISITQNGDVIGSMKRNTKEFELCLSYDDVDIENDVFEFAKTSDDGVCITSLSIDGNDILVGPLNTPNQPNFWIDGNDNSCTDNFVSTQQLIVQNNAVISSECDAKFCIKMTSSPDEDLCQHPKASNVNTSWSGNTVLIKQNGNTIGSMTKNTKEFQVCIEYDDVDAANDVFEIVKSGNDGVCITSLSIDGTDILVGPNNIPNQPNFWIDGNDNSCTDDFVSTQQLIIQNGAVLSSECDPKFCIEMTSSPDEDLCQHPKASNVNTSWSGNTVHIKQNGNTIGSMTRNTKEFRVCVDYDQVNAASDVFEIVKSGNDGVCITSLSMDGTDILVGNDQPNFWIDGNDNGCTDDWISTPKLTIVNGETQLEGCSDYCIRVTSGLDQGLCNNPKWPNAWENWSGGDVAVNYNGNQVATMERGFTDFEYCMPRWAVDAENDEFQLSTPHSKGVCVTSFTVDGQAILVGPNNDKPSFWLDTDWLDCLDTNVATSEITVKNGQVASSYCDNDLYCIKVTSGLDLDKCHHPSWPDAAANNWQGEPATLKHKGRKLATLFTGFTEYEFCLLRSDVDIANDKFILETDSNDGFCVHSMTFDGEEVKFGKNKDLVSFWLDDNVECRDDFMAATKVAVKNGEVNWDYCMEQ